MKTLSIITVSAILVASQAYAGCTGIGNFKTCHDNSGNSYTINKIGNMTTMTGRNARTGSSWSANTQRLGNMTITNGRAANGNSWNSTTQKLGSSTITSGRDSSGKFFSRTCNQFGCY